MGTAQQKQNHKSNEITEECKREYFKNAKRNFSEGIKKINSTIHAPEENFSYSENNWIDYLLNKFTDYLKNKKINSKLIGHILNYLNNLEESNEVKHVHNLSIYLKKEIEDMAQANTRRQSFIDKYFTEEENKSNSGIIINLSKDEMLWKGSEFIFKDIEDINHPLNGFVRHLTFILSEVYEKEYERIVHNIEQTNSLNLKDFQYHSDILIEGRNSLVERRLSMEELKYKHKYTSIHSEETTKNLNSSYLFPNKGISLADNKQIEEFYKAMHNEIFVFSAYLANALIRFYSIKNSTSPKLFEIFCEKIKDLLIRKELYSLIYKIKSRLNQKKKEKYSQCLLDFYNIKPYYLCTSPYFSLDKNFKRLLKNYARCKQISKKKEKSINTIPFSKTILLFRDIKESDSIIKKIDVMYQLRTSILSEIDEFWKDLPLKSKYKSVDADNLLSIFIYLIIKCQIDSLVIDQEIIDDFTNRSLKLSRKGYFFSLLQSSIEYLIGSLSISQLDFNITEYNKMLDKEILILDSTPEVILDLDKTCKCEKCVEKIEEDKII